jgi:hypothetical protein
MTFSRPYISNIEIKFPFSTYTFKKLYGGRVSENIFSCYVIARDMRVHSRTVGQLRNIPVKMFALREIGKNTAKRA